MAGILPTSPSVSNIEPVECLSDTEIKKTIEAIENHTAILYFDAAVKKNCMAYHGIITDQKNSFESTYKEATNAWHATKSDLAEGQALLGVLHHIQRKIPSTTNGSFEILTDSQNVVKWTSVTYTASRASKPGGEIWVSIQKIQETLKNIKFSYTWIPDHPKPCTNFNQNAHAYLITKTHQWACDLRRNMEQEITTVTIPEIEIDTIHYNGKRDFRSMNTLLKEEDSKFYTYNYISKKFPQYANMIDIDARSVFGSGLKPHEIKCAAGFNHYVCRDHLINPLITDKCDLCGLTEDLVHILTCRANYQENIKFLTDLKSHLLKIDTQKPDIIRFISDIGDFLEGRQDVRGTQTLVGHKNLFRGIVVKDWYGSDDSKGMYHVLNKIIVCKCVKHYTALWRARNHHRNNAVLRKERLLEWVEKETTLFKNHTNPNVARYLEQYDSIKKMSADAIQLWLHNLHTFKKNAENDCNNNILSFLVPRS